MTDKVAATDQNWGHEAPLAALLSQDTDCDGDSTKWPDYPERFGIGAADNPALTRMAADMAPHGSQTGSLEV